MLCILQTKMLILRSANLEFAIVSGWFVENCMALTLDKCIYVDLGFDEPFKGFSFNDFTKKFRCFNQNRKVPS